MTFVYQSKQTSPYTFAAKASQLELILLALSRFTEVMITQQRTTAMISVKSPQRFSLASQTLLNFDHFICLQTADYLHISAPLMGAIHSIASRNIDFENLAAKVSTIIPSSESLMQFRTAIKEVLDNSKSRSTKEHRLDNLNRSKICECIGKCFSDQKVGGEISLKLTHRHELCKDLVFLGL